MILKNTKNVNNVVCIQNIETHLLAIQRVPILKQHIK